MHSKTSSETLQNKTKYHSLSLYSTPTFPSRHSTLPDSNSFIKPEDDLLLTENPTETLSTPQIRNQTISPDLLTSLKSSIQNLQQETARYKQSFLSLKNRETVQKSKDPNTLTTQKLSSLKSTLRSLNSKLIDSEKKAKKTIEDSEDLKKVVQTLSSKISEKQLFDSSKDTSCQINCQII